MKKKTMAALAAVCFVFASAPALATEPSGVCGDNAQWRFEDGTLTISGSGVITQWFSSYYTENTDIERVVIEDGITGIDIYAFGNCTALKSVSIGEDVEYINFRAFSGCDALESIVLPDKTEVIGDYAFDGCTALSEIDLGGGITQIGRDAFRDTAYVNDPSNEEGGAVYCGEYLLCAAEDAAGECEIKDGTRLIAEWAFFKREGLTGVRIPSGITDIPYAAFRSCTALESIELPEGVESIGDEAFYNCSSVERVDIPKSLKHVGGSAFLGCTGVREVHIKDLAAWCGIDFEYSMSNPFCCEEMYHTDSDVIKDLYLNGEKITDLRIPEDVTRIGDHAFCGWTGAESVYIPGNIEAIGSEAFLGCVNIKDVYTDDLSGWCSLKFELRYANPLWYAENFYVGGESVKSVTVPDDVEEIGQWTFAGTVFTDITLPENVKSIAGFAFDGCSELKELTVSDELLRIGFSAFSGCDALTDIYYSGTEGEWSLISMGAENQALTEAELHCTGVLPEMTEAEIDMDTGEGVYGFTVTPETAYEKCTVYAAVYGAGGRLLNVSCAPLEMSGGTRVDAVAAAGGVKAKVFVLTRTGQPVVRCEEFDISVL